MFPAHPPGNDAPASPHGMTLPGLRLADPEFAKQITDILATRSHWTPGPHKHPVERAVDLIEVRVGRSPPSREQLSGERQVWVDTPIRELAYDALLDAIQLGACVMPTSASELQSFIDALLRTAGLSDESDVSRRAGELRRRLTETLCPRPPEVTSESVKSPEAPTPKAVAVYVDPDGKTDEVGTPRSGGKVKCRFHTPGNGLIHKSVTQGTVASLEQIGKTGEASWQELADSDKRPQRLVDLLATIGMSAEIVGQGRGRRVRCGGAIEVHHLARPLDAEAAIQRAVFKGRRWLRSRGME
ncbi:MAG: hypothetical protein KDB73_15210 [Planctomycetes bacterium]|nr:hypothetical protein [Planctomycetota bacterium]